MNQENQENQQNYLNKPAETGTPQDQKSHLVNQMKTVDKENKKVHENQNHKKRKQRRQRKLHDNNNQEGNR